MLNLKEITIAQLKSYLDKLKDYTPTHFFNSVEFIESLIIDGKHTIILGIFDEESLLAYICLGNSNDNYISSPFSSTLGGFEILIKKPSLNQIDNLVACFRSWKQESKWNKFKITLNNDEYKKESNEFSYLLNSFIRAGSTISDVDLSFFIEIQSWNDSLANRNFRRKLKKANDSHLKLLECLTIDQKENCYTVIKENRKEKGFPLHLSFEYLLSISKINKVDFFLVNNVEKCDLAAAICYHMNADVILVVYWGDLLEYRDVSGMAFLIYGLITHYKLKDKQILDTGTSTAQSIPNYGLTTFKSEIGAKAVQKITLEI